MQQHHICNNEVQAYIVLLNNGAVTSEKLVCRLVSYVRPPLLPRHWSLGMEPHATKVAAIARFLSARRLGYLLHIGGSTTTRTQSLMRFLESE